MQHTILHYIAPFHLNYPNLRIYRNETWPIKALLSVEAGQKRYYNNHYLIIIHWNRYLFSDWLKAYSEFWKSMPLMSSSCRLYKVMSRALNKAMGDRVMYISSALFLRVIMSNSHALCCLPSVKKQKHDFHFYFVQCIIFSFIIWFCFCDIQNNQGYQPQPSALADNPLLNLDYFE